MRIEFFFDFACPFAYLASREIEGVAERTGAELVWRPILLGGVLRAIGSEELLAKQPAARNAYLLRDRTRCAEVRGAPLSPHAIHPQSTVRALRTVLAVEDGPKRVALVHELYRAYWERGQRLEEESVLRAALDACGIDTARPLAAGADPAVKQELRQRTDEAIARGVFGVPAAIVHTARGEMLFWGQDRLEQVEAVLAGWHPADGRPPERPTAGVASTDGGGAAVIEFWFDYASPWTYIASTQIEQVAARTGAELVWRPMLLGAVFKQIGQANVPLFAMPEAKRRWIGTDLDLWTAWWGVPFRFTSHFPQRSLTALRIAMVAGDRIAEVSHALFRAAWVEDRNLDDETTLAAVLGSLGLDAAALLARTREAATKQALIDSTTAAVHAGVFGAPSFVVRRDGAARLFFGQDRLDQVERAARGEAVPSS
jgi:2-hydroxychromene-2-carboxylate isomerase